MCIDQSRQQKTTHHLGLFTIAGFGSGLHDTACAKPASSTQSRLDIDLCSLSTGAHLAFLSIGLSPGLLEPTVHLDFKTLAQN